MQMRSLFFETLNDRGLELAKTDLLKNHLFSLSDDRLDEIQHLWVQMFSTIEAAEDEDLVLSYLRHFWSSKNGLTREKKSLREHETINIK